MEKRGTCLLIRVYIYRDKVGKENKNTHWVWEVKDVSCEIEMCAFSYGHINKEGRLKSQN